MKKQKEIPGGIIRIAIDSVHNVYGRILNFGDVAFYDFVSNSRTEDLNKIIKAPILFKAVVNIGGVVMGRWPIIGYIPLEKSLQHSKYWLPEIGHDSLCKIIENGVWKFNVPIEESMGLEEGTVWSPEQIEKKLCKHFGLEVSPLPIYKMPPVKQSKITLKKVTLYKKFIDIVLEYIELDVPNNHIIHQMRPLIDKAIEQKNNLGVMIAAEDLTEMIEGFPKKNKDELSQLIYQKLRIKIDDLFD